MKIPYGYLKTSDGQVVVNKLESNVVKLIFQRYLNGDSLSKIAELLSEKKVLSPTGKEVWARSSIDKLLSKSKYAPCIISFEQYCAVQLVKYNRSNLDIDKGQNQRKATRYSSQNVLSGLLVCAECGANYRRITRNSGEVVWRCANRVEHGKEICKHSPTISEDAVISFVCEVLGVQQLDSQTVRDSLDTILVNGDGTMISQYKQTQAMTLSR